DVCPQVSSHSIGGLLRPPGGREACNNATRRGIAPVAKNRRLRSATHPIRTTGITPAMLTRVHRINAAAPDDVAGFQALVTSGQLDPKGVVAILGKTEGNGCVNDFTRGFASATLTRMIADYTGEPLEAVERRVALVMSGGTEGGLSPHWLVFDTVATDDTLKSMGYSRGASALGVALALGEHKAVSEDAVCRDVTMFSRCASTSAGVELLENQILVIGNSAAWSGDLVIAHDVMAD